jgi:elongation factor Ts
MAITAKDVQELRQRTGAGMMDCKKALEETAGEIDKAIELLRMKGIAKAERRAGRTATEGQIVNAAARGLSALVEVNCETDFVARTDDFGSLAGALADLTLAHETLNGSIADAASAPAGEAGGGPLGDKATQLIKDASARMGENIVVRRYARFATSGEVGVYIHHNGKVGVMVELVGASGPEVLAAARSIAEHVAAGVPAIALGISKAEIPAEVVERERRIFEEQARASGKPDNIVEKMIGGRLEKYYREVSLLEQPWVRDDSRSVASLVEEAAKKVGATLEIQRFVRFQMGD